VNKAELAGDTAGKRCFSRSGRPVDRYDDVFGIHLAWRMGWTT
jgi:hypothetical protein